MDVKVIVLHIVIGFSFSMASVYSEQRLEKCERRVDDIVEKLTRVEAILEGLESMCKSLKMIQPNDDDIGNKDVNKEIAEGQDGVKSGINNDNNGKDKIVNGCDDVVDIDIGEDKRERQYQQLELISIESAGVHNRAINVTITFNADKSSVVEWYTVRKYNMGLSTRSNGKICKGILDEGRIQFTSEVTFQDVDSLKLAYVDLTSAVSYARINFNEQALNVKGKHEFTDIEYKILEFTPELIVSADSLKSNGFKTTIKVSENVIEKMKTDYYSPYIVGTFVNTSTPSPSLVELWGGKHFNELELAIIPKDDSRNELILTLNKEHAQLGGFIKLFLVQESQNDYIFDFFYGVRMRLINQDIGDVMPYGTFGLHGTYSDEHLVTGPCLSIDCSAFGIPRPTLRLFKKGANDALVELKADGIISHDVYFTKFIEFDPTRDITPAGKYVCQASNGDTLIEQEMTYLSTIIVDIIHRDTKLVTNTSEKTVVTCTASGIPTPTIELRANSHDGTNLLESQNNQFKHTLDIVEYVTTVMLEIEPPDKDISSIYCVATQYIDNAMQRTSEIVLRPVEAGVDLS